MATTINAEKVFKDLWFTMNGHNYTDYNDRAIFDVNIKHFLVTFRLDKKTGKIDLASDVTDYSRARDYGEEKEMV